MHVQKLLLSNFRNYGTDEICFSSDLNIIEGLNGHGKTNLLEAIYLVCLGRSFRAASNEDMLKTGASSFTVDGSICLSSELQKRVVVRYEKEGRKQISVDNKKTKSHAEVIGQFPVVVMSPDEYKITTGGPAERRRFIDVLLSQSRVSYLSDLQEYGRVLKQRNKILQNIRDGFESSRSVIQPWSYNLATIGARITEARMQFVDTFFPSVNAFYARYAASADNVSASIQSALITGDLSQIRSHFLSALDESREKEIITGTTLIGPHRDDLEIKINDKDLRRLGSRGEHKSVLISIKLAEFEFLRRQKHEDPVVILDDFNSELDSDRERRVFSSISGLSQVFISTPKKGEFLSYSKELGHFQNVSSFSIVQGHIR